MNRRKLLKFLGVSAFSINNSMLISACTSLASKPKLNVGVSPNFNDEVTLMDGLSYYRLIKWNDIINESQNLKFGYNNDYIQLARNKNNETMMWVNHEYVVPMFVSGYNEKTGHNKTKEQIDVEKASLGGTCFKIEKVNGQWKVDPRHEDNATVNGHTKIDFSPKQKINGSSYAVGTFLNCAGGKTSWNTILTCEENYQNVVGDVFLEPKNKLKRVSSINNKLSWEAHGALPAEHYGWVVEYDPIKKTSKKLVSLGRFSHECATCVVAKDGRTVVYMGDDKVDEHIYKFIADSPGQLDRGTLYVADTINGKWRPLDYKIGEPFQSHFQDQQQMLIFTRQAAKLVGATPLDRPEDVEIHPVTGDIYVALTKNKPKGNHHGSILKISENNKDPLSLSFKAETFMGGGDTFSCPDNLAFDKKGNLWMTSDISGGSIGNSTYKKFGNNGLFCIPTQGKNAGEVIQVASAPNEAEFTGPCFSEDYKTLFLSVQHPGEKSKSLESLTSQWPHDIESKLPHPAVICIEGDFLKQMTT